MALIGSIISLVFISIVAYLSITNYNSHSVLLLSGLLIMSIALAIGLSLFLVIITAKIAGFKPYNLAKRTRIPLTVVALCMPIYHFMLISIHG